MIVQDAIAADKLSYKNPGDIPLRPNHRNSLTYLESIFILINACMTSGIFYNGFRMKYGILYSTIFNLIAAICTYYSSWMILVSIYHYHVFSYEELISAAFGKKFIIVPLLGCVLPSVFIVSFFFNSLGNISQFFLFHVIPNCPSQVFNIFIIGILIIIFIFPPFFLSKTPLYLSISSKIGLPLLAIVLFHHIYYDISNAKKYGFDPRGELKLFKQTNFYQDIRCFLHNIENYNNYIYMFMLLGNMTDLTYNRAKKFLKQGLIIIFLLNMIFQITEYFVIFDRPNNTYLFLFLNPKNIVSIFGIISFFFKVIFSIPVYINPARLSICHFVSSYNNFSLSLWAAIGVLLTFIALGFSSLIGSFLIVMSGTSTLMIAVLQYLFPALLMIKELKRNNRNKLHWLGAIFFIIFSLLMIIGSIIVFVKGF